MPPTRLSAASARNDSRSAPATRLRPAHPVVTCPGNNATVEVMFASRGSKPGQDQRGQRYERSAPGERVLRPRPQTGGEKESEEEHAGRVRERCGGVKPGP